MLTHRMLAAAATALALVPGAFAQAQTQVSAQGPAPTRAEVPIREVILSDGARRYTIPVKVGATTLEAGLDTGSSGLRVLPGALSPDDAHAGWEGSTYSYGSGAKLDGVMGKGVVDVGGLSAPTTLQLVRTVGCTSAKPHCPASRIPQSQYGVQGDGLPGEGFRAIVGVNMAEAEVATPLRAIGARRWIVDLPRPGESGPGRLVLNPTDDEAKGFVMLPVVAKFDGKRGGLHDAVTGCLVNQATKVKACGVLMLDTGAPGIQVAGADLGRRPWPEGTPAILAFYDGNGKVQAAEKLVIGQKSHASRLEFEEGSSSDGTVIYSGLAAYFAFSVLYDPAHGLVGLKPRPSTADGPKGELLDEAP